MSISDITIAWDSAYNGYQDGLGALILADIGVYDTETDLPLEHIEVEVGSGFAGVYIIPAEAVRLVDYPEAGVDPSDRGAIEDACTDENDNFQNDDEWCAWYWDTESGQYYQFGGDYASAGGYGPNYFVGQTDGRGLLRLYLYADVMPSEGDGDEISFSSVNMWASIQVDSSSFSITPAGSN